MADVQSRINDLAFRIDEADIDDPDIPSYQEQIRDLLGKLRAIPITMATSLPDLECVEPDGELLQRLIRMGTALPRLIDGKLLMVVLDSLTLVAGLQRGP
jgi:hypothetical protein